MAHEGDEPESDKDEADGASLGDEPLSNMTSLEAGESSSLARFLSKPVPRRKATPLPAKRSTPPPKKKKKKEKA